MIRITCDACGKRLKPISLELIKGRDKLSVLALKDGMLASNGDDKPPSVVCNVKCAMLLEQQQGTGKFN